MIVSVDATVCGRLTVARRLGCHRRRIDDRIVYDKLVQVLRFGCSYDAIADASCSAATIRNRRDEWIATGVFAKLETIALDACARRVTGLVTPMWTAVSPKPLVAENAPGRPRSIAANRA